MSLKNPIRTALTIAILFFGKVAEWRFEFRYNGDKKIKKIEHFMASEIVDPKQQSLAASAAFLMVAGLVTGLLVAASMTGQLPSNG